MNRQLSIWERETILPDVDCLIVGAGIVGLTASRIVSQRNPSLSVCVIEKDAIGSVASSRNAGFACFGSVSEIASDLQEMSEAQVKTLINNRRTGLKKLSDRYGIQELDLDICGGYELFRDQQSFEANIEQIKYINTLLDHPTEVFVVEDTPYGMNFYNKCIFNRLEGHLNTGLMYQAIEKDCLDAGVRIIRGLEVKQLEDAIDGVKVRLAYGEIQAQKVIIATNALAGQLVPEIAIAPARNQVLVTQPIKKHGIHGTFHLDEGFIYFRDLGNRILIGGGRHLFEEEQTLDHGINQENISYLMDLLKERVLPHRDDLSIYMNWSGIIAPKPSKIPIVKKVSDHITIGVRLGGMGVAIGMKIGEDVATLSMS